MHAAISTVTAGGLYLAAWGGGQPTSVCLALSAGCLAGILITPDLDVDFPVRSHGMVRENAGLLPFLAWRLLWLPYAWLIPHRSWLSHAPVVGTALRLLYLWLAALLALLPLFAVGINLDWSNLPDGWGWAVLGLGISDALHWAADSGASRARRLFRPRLRWLG